MPTCQECRDCADCPTCPGCEVCGPPGGGGLLRLAPLYAPRDVRKGDHGEFSLWGTRLIYGARVYAVNGDGTVNLWCDAPNGDSQIKVQNIPVAKSGEQWATYLTSNEIYVGYRRLAMDRADKAWSKLGNDPLRSIFVPGVALSRFGIVMPSNHEGVDCDGQVLRPAEGCGCSVIVHAVYSTGNGWGDLKLKKASGSDRDTFLLRRKAWVEILSSEMAVAESQIDAYRGDYRP